MSGEITLSWTNPKDADFDYVEITFTPGVEGMGQPITVTKPGIRKTITGFRNGQQYVFTVKAADTSMNKSEGAIVSVTPQGETGTEGTGNPSTATLRYETVPSSSYNLVYSAYDNTSYYYIFLIGKVNNVPLVSGGYQKYNGSRPITLSYSQVNVNAQSVARSIQKATEYSVTNGSSWNGEVGVSVGPEWLNFTGSYNWGESRDETETRSTADTYETSETISHETGTGGSTTIGEDNEPAGLYRYSYFTVTDAYYVIKTNRQKTAIIDNYTMMCARPNGRWDIDYDSDEGNSFGKTASGDLLKIPNVPLSQLPTPTENNIEPIPTENVARPVANNKGGTYELSVDITLTSATKDAIIYYTIDGNTPSVASARYTSPITITQATTLKAIAVKSGMGNSEIMTETYSTITLVKTWSVTSVREIKPIQHSPKDESFNPNLPISVLNQFGYLKLEIKVDFDYKSYNTWVGTQCGTLRLQLANYNGAELGWSDFGTSDWKRASYSKTVSIDETGSATGEFKIFWSRVEGDGLLSSDFEVGTRTITVTALK
jgi:hypothetical protein